MYYPELVSQKVRNMKRHFDEFDVTELHAVIQDWTEARNMQADCVSALMDRFGVQCADEAVDLLNSRMTAREIMDRHCVEIHSHASCSLPWYLDRQTGFVVLFALSGAVLAVFSAGS
jgi:hypothetical protein